MFATHTADRTASRASVGDLRFNLPQAVDAYNGSYTATSYGPACPQQAFDFPEFSGLPQAAIDLVVNTVYNVITPAAEDCTSRRSRPPFSPADPSPRASAAPRPVAQRRRPRGHEAGCEPSGGSREYPQGQLHASSC